MSILIQMDFNCDNNVLLFSQLVLLQFLSLLRGWSSHCAGIFLEKYALQLQQFGNSSATITTTACWCYDCYRRGSSLIVACFDCFSYFLCLFRQLRPDNATMLLLHASISGQSSFTLTLRVLMLLTMGWLREYI